jgi:HD superfamily phosphodiesterase
MMNTGKARDLAGHRHEFRELFLREWEQETEGKEI